MMGRRMRLRTQRGFSLIETLISSALFFVGLTAVFTTFNTATRLLAHHRHMTRAVAIAEGTLEELIHRYPGDAAIDVGVTPAARTYDRDGVMGGSTFSATWTVTSFALLDGIREVVVTVSWFEEGKPKKLSLKTWRS